MNRVRSLGEPRYLYRGWLISRVTRDWTWPRGATGWTPRVQWTVKRMFRAGAPVRTFDTRREAAAWVDEQIREEERG